MGKWLALDGAKVCRIPGRSRDFLARAHVRYARARDALCSGTSVRAKHATGRAMLVQAGRVLRADYSVGRCEKYYPPISECARGFTPPGN